MSSLEAAPVAAFAKETISACSSITATQPKIVKFRDCFILRSSYQTGKNTKRRTTNVVARGYPSVELAQQDAELFFNAVITDGGAHWQNYNERSLKISDGMIEYQRLMTQSNQIIGQKRLRPQLNIAQQKMFSKISKISRKNKEIRYTILQFQIDFDSTVFSEDEIKRFQRSKSRVKMTDLSGKDRLKHHHYTQRLQLLKDKAEKERQSVIYLQHHYYANTVYKLVIHLNELAPRSDSSAEDFSQKQIMRTMMQAQMVASILKSMYKRTSAEISIITNYIDALQQPHTLIEDEINNAAYTLDVKLTKLRRENSIPHIIQEVWSRELGTGDESDATSQQWKAAYSGA